MRKIKLLRIAIGIKQIELAKHLGLQQANYTNIENGKLIPNNLEEIKRKALLYLKPYLEIEIKNTQEALKILKELKRDTAI